MSGNVDTYPKTVNLDSSIPVNSQMKRIVKNNCPNGITTKCLKKSYNIPIAGNQRNNNWGTIQGYPCKGPIGQWYNVITDNAGTTLSACVTKYTGITQNSHLLAGYCQYSGATANGKFIIKKTNGTVIHQGTVRNVSPVLLGNIEGYTCGLKCGLYPSCEFFNADFVRNTNVPQNNINLLFSAVCGSPSSISC